MTSNHHWMNSVLSKACGAAAAGTLLPPELTLSEVWSAAAEAMGVEEAVLADEIATYFRLPRASFRTLDGKAQNLVPESIARKHLVFPLREDYRRLVVASADPGNMDAEQAISFASGRAVTLEVATPGEIEEALLAHFSPDQAAAKILHRVGSEVGEEFRLIEEEEEESPAIEETGSGPVVNLTNVILREAVEAGSSDIHLQPGRHGGVIRYRIDGVLRTAGHMPSQVLSRVVSRVKIIGRLDIADRIRPQDGRAKVAFGDRQVDLRISTVPTRGAEKVVIRILDPKQARALEETGLLGQELTRFKHLLSYREGIVVVTGPTGSGKTTSLYAALKHIHTEDINIMTVEDPVEYDLPGLTQIQVEPKQGVTFPSALRAILRQDPDVLFVGEIRDEETARIAAQASLTGHLVLSTLHTNDAAGAVGRFLDLGLDPHTLSDTLRGILAQRLVRTACPECSVPVQGELTAEEARLAEEYGVRPVVRAVGCAACGEMGYLGRVPLVEVINITPEVRTLVAEGADSPAIMRVAKKGGYRSLREVGAIRVAQGETTLEELERVLGDVGGEGEAFLASKTGTPGAQGETDSHREGASSSPRILLVDDDGANRTIARALLEREGFFVEEAEDGVEAIECLRKVGDFNLVVLDLDLPRKGGREVLAEIRGNMATVGLPVLVLTGTSDPETEFELMDAGADDYVRKPFDPRRFTSRVRAVLRRAAG